MFVLCPVPEKWNSFFFFGQWRSLVFQVINKLMLPPSESLWYYSVSGFTLELGALCELLRCVSFSLFFIELTDLSLKSKHRCRQFYSESDAFAFATKFPSIVVILIKDLINDLFVYNQAMTVTVANMSSSFLRSQL